MLLECLDGSSGLGLSDSAAHALPYPNEIDATYIVVKVDEALPCMACCFSMLDKVKKWEARGCILLGQDGEADCACPPGCAFKEIDEILEDL